MRDIRVAAVQVTSFNGQVARNLAHATRYVTEAADRGAQLILCPEFLAAGYIYEPSIWEAAEPRDGPTEWWLRELASTHSAYIGASYLEVDGKDFHNTFTLVGPDGRVAGRVRKQSLPAFEGWFFRPCSRPKIIETAIGRLGVGICNDNQTACFLDHMFDEQPDLILMPHSAPTVDLPVIGEPVARAFDQTLARSAPNYARALGVPTVLANKVAYEHTSTSLPIAPFLRLRWRFRGFSSICAADGTELQRLVDREGVLVANVTLDESLKRTDRPPTSGYWSFGPPSLRRFSAALWVTLDHAGRLAYRLSRQRKAAAQRLGF